MFMGTNFPSMAGPLLNALADREQNVRGAAAATLGILHIDPQHSIPALVSLLQDPSIPTDIRETAALRYYGAEALPALRAAVTNKSDIVARRIEEAVKLIETQGPLQIVPAPPGDANVHMPTRF
jgi:hypothetical protein